MSNEIQRENDIKRGSGQCRLGWRRDMDEDQRNPIEWACARQCWISLCSRRKSPKSECHEFQTRVLFGKVYLRRVRAFGMTGERVVCLMCRAG